MGSAAVSPRTQPCAVPAALLQLPWLLLLSRTVRNVACFSRAGTVSPSPLSCATMPCTCSIIGCVQGAGVKWRDIKTTKMFA